MFGRQLVSPLTVASGTFAAGREYAEFTDITRLGAVTTKGVSLTPWAGNTGKRIHETASGLLNSIGLQNPGVETFCEKDLGWLADHAPDLPVIVNVSGHTIDDYVGVIERLEREPAVFAYELNISCPNVDAGGMVFGTDCTAAAGVVAAARAATKRPLIVKLSPNVTDVTAIARAVADAGADAVSLINTLLGTAIDPLTGRFVFDRRVAGLSGPAIKPVALRMVWQCAQVLDIPIIGMGGVTGGCDVVEFLRAGATMVALGTVNFGDPGAVGRILTELDELCARIGVTHVADLIGTAA
jgi:dihydroorotate dehydrogenase (NAD+) catalytic subunit